MASQRLDIDYNLATCIATLSIKEAKQPTDVGTYHVLAENEHGRAETACQLFIEAVPNIDETAYVNPDLFRYFDGPHPPAPQQQQQRTAPAPQSLASQLKPHTPRQQAAANNNNNNNDEDEDPNAPKEPSLIVQPLRDRECFEGENVTFVCEVRGSPRPTVEWRYNEQPLPAAQRFFFDYSLSDGKCVFVISFTKLDDGGTYSLVATNPYGECSTSARLVVKQLPSVDDTAYVNPDIFRQLELKHQQPKPKPLTAPGSQAKMRSMPPHDSAHIRIVVPLKDVHARKDESALLTCKIDAQPRPEVVWLRNGEPLLHAPHMYAKEYDESTGTATLLIKAVRPSDVAEYKCVAYNTAGSDETTCHLLIAITLPSGPAAASAEPTDNDEAKYIAPYFVQVPKDLEVSESSPVRLDCLALGVPAPQLTWYFNNAPFKEDDTHRVRLTRY